MTNIILAVVGLAGSGKTEAVKHLMQKTGWPKIYLGQAVIDEVKRRGQEINEANERAAREELRKRHGMAAMAIANLPKIREMSAASSLLIESLYSWEEYLTLKEEFGARFTVLAIFASPATRAARMRGRKIRPLTAEELQSRDYSQIENLHQAGPIARADWAIINEGSVEEFRGQIGEIVNKLQS